MRKLILSAWGLVRENWRAYAVINIAYYGLVAVFMVYVAFHQALQEELLAQIGAAFMGGPLSFVGQAYSSAQVLPAIAATFFVNLLLGSLAEITLPSLIIPFSGLIMGVVRAVLWGLILSPANPGLRLAMIPHSLTLLLEGQGYILALLAVYVQGRAFLWPQTAGVEGHARGYVEGLKRTGKLYVLVTLVLAVAAVYEVIEVLLLARFAP
jgi:hypothetical protein